MFKVPYKEDWVYKFWLLDAGQKWLEELGAYSPLLAGTGKLNTVALGCVSVMIDHIRRGELHHPDNVKGFFRAGNLVARADNNYADLMVKHPREKKNQTLFMKAA